MAAVRGGREALHSPQLLIQDSLVELSLSGRIQQTWVAARNEDFFVVQKCLGGRSLSLVEDKSLCASINTLEESPASLSGRRISLVEKSPDLSGRRGASVATSQVLVTEQEKLVNFMDY